MICFCNNKETLSRLLPDEYPNKIHSFNDKPEILDSEWVLWVGEVILQPDMVNRLKKDLRTHLDAGLVSGLDKSTMDYVVDDIYNPIKLNPVEEKDLIKADVIPRDLFICKGRVFKELDLGEKFFGLSVRKLGYQNYIDKDVLIEKENKNAKDNNVKGFTCGRKNDLG